MLYGPNGKPIRTHEDERPVITFVITKDRKQFAYFCKELGVKPEIDNVHHLTSPRQLIGIDPGKVDVEFRHWGEYKRSPVMREGGEWQRELKRLLEEHGETRNPLDYKNTDEVELDYEAQEIQNQIDKGKFN